MLFILSACRRETSNLSIKTQCEKPVVVQPITVQLSIDEEGDDYNESYKDTISPSNDLLVVSLIIVLFRVNLV